LIVTTYSASSGRSLRRQASVPTECRGRCAKPSCPCSAPTGRRWRTSPTWSGTGHGHDRDGLPQGDRARTAAWRRGHGPAIYLTPVRLIRGGELRSGRSYRLCGMSMLMGMGRSEGRFLQPAWIRLTSRRRISGSVSRSCRGRWCRSLFGLGRGLHRCSVEALSARALSMACTSASIQDW
jgi:hypothetical protein